MRIVSKKDVEQWVADRISREWGYTQPPEVIMLSDGSIVLKEDSKGKDLKKIVNDALIADIRNKLGPVSNLCAMLKHVPRELTDDSDINNYIMSEVKNVEKSIDYLSNLNNDNNISSVSSNLDWIFSRYEKCFYDKINNEKKLLELLELPWYKKLFMTNKKMRYFLNYE